MIRARGDQDQASETDQARREKKRETGDVIVKVSGAAKGLASGHEAAPAKRRSDRGPARKANEPPGSTGSAPQKDDCAEERNDIHQCDEREVQNNRLPKQAIEQKTDLTG